MCSSSPSTSAMAAQPRPYNSTPSGHRHEKGPMVVALMSFDRAAGPRSTRAVLKRTINRSGSPDGGGPVAVGGAQTVEILDPDPTAYKSVKCVLRRASGRRFGGFLPHPVSGGGGRRRRWYRPMPGEFRPTFRLASGAVRTVAPWANSDRLSTPCTAPDTKHA